MNILTAEQRPVAYRAFRVFRGMIAAYRFRWRKFGTHRAIPALDSALATDMHNRNWYVQPI
jgi:hypothetical protein